LTFHEISYVKLDTKSHGKNFQKIIAHLFSKKDPILRLGFLNNILWGLSTVMGVWMLQRYWQAQNIDLKYFGVLWAAFNLTAAFTGKIAHNLERHIGPVSLLVAIGCAPIAGYLGMVMWPNAFGVACGAFFYVGRGFNYVMLKDIVNWRTPSSIRTTVNSAQSFCFRLGFAIFGPLVGLGVDRFGMNRALSLLAAIFTVFFFAAMLPLINTIRKTSIDYIPEIPLID
jgi:Na+/melibiose symporter-like transporter